MTLFTLTVLWLISMMWGYCADKKFLLQNPHLKEFNLAQIMKEVDEILDDKNNEPSINNIKFFILLINFFFYKIRCQIIKRI
jgi:hypothetical protein